MMKRVKVKILRLELGSECTPRYLGQTDGLMIDSRALDTGYEAQFFLPFEEISKALQSAYRTPSENKSVTRRGGR